MVQRNIARKASLLSLCPARIALAVLIEPFAFTNSSDFSKAILVIPLFCVRAG